MSPEMFKLAAELTRDRDEAHAQAKLIVDSIEHLRDDWAIEAVAEAIYRTSGGLTDDDHVEVVGAERRSWQIGDAINDDDDRALHEWERDEYRTQGRAAVEAMLGVLGTLLRGKQ